MTVKVQHDHIDLIPCLIRDFLQDFPSETRTTKYGTRRANVSVTMVSWEDGFNVHLRSGKHSYCVLSDGSVIKGTDSWANGFPTFVYCSLAYRGVVSVLLKFARPGREHYAQFIYNVIDHMSNPDDLWGRLNDRMAT